MPIYVRGGSFSIILRGFYSRANYFRAKGEKTMNFHKVSLVQNQKKIIKVLRSSGIPTLIQLRESKNIEEKKNEIGTKKRNFETDLE